MGVFDLFTGLIELNSSQLINGYGYKSYNDETKKHISYANINQEYNSFTTK